MKIRFGIVGCGFLGNIIANAWKDGFLEDYELVGVTSRVGMYRMQILSGSCRTALLRAGIYCGGSVRGSCPGYGMHRT